MASQILSTLKLILDLGLIVLDIFNAAMDVYRKCRDEFLAKYSTEAQTT
jgi:hypothetical protein